MKNGIENRQELGVVKGLEQYSFADQISIKSLE